MCPGEHKVRPYKKMLLDGDLVLVGGHKGPTHPNKIHIHPNPPALGQANKPGKIY
jgi:hypothetical protein